jgi:glycosyltransferase involved in cell wall biosynthesis
MKILLINIRYVHISGPERYLFNLKDILERNSHKVIPFSIKYSQNEPSEYSQYFVSPLSDDESIFYKNQKKDVRSVYKTLERNFYSKEVEDKLTSLIEDTKPDFAFVLLYLRKLSPAVLVALHKMNIPFLVRLSDFGMICPSHNLFREHDICELCLGGNLINSVKHKCVHHSYGASIVNYLATKYHSHKGYFNLIPHFASPSKFLIKKMVEAGWDERKFFHLPTFAVEPPHLGLERKPHQLLYAGRLEYIKGIHHLLEAVKLLSLDYGMQVNLKIAGNGDEKYVTELKKYATTNGLNQIEFLGNLNKNELLTHYQESILSVVPSLVYDNIPNSALESLSCGTPVIAPNHGCFPELIIDGQTGFLYKPQEAKDMAKKIFKVLDDISLQNTLRKQSLEFIEKYHSPKIHYNILESIMKRVKYN